MWQSPFPFSFVTQGLQQFTSTVRGPVTIRPYQAKYHGAIQRLYADGLLQGDADPSDLGVDLDHIEDAYFDDPANHFWVAIIKNQVVGMVGVMRDDTGVAEIRRLRIDPQCRAGSIAAKLIQAAIEHCERHGYLKIMLERDTDSDTALRLLDQFGYQFTRTRVFHGRDTMEFYANIYQSPDMMRAQPAVRPAENRQARTG